MLAPSHQFPVSSLSSTSEASARDYAGQTQACVCTSVQWQSLERIYLEIKIITIRHYSQQHCD